MPYGDFGDYKPIKIRKIPYNEKLVENWFVNNIEQKQMLASLGAVSQRYVADPKNSDKIVLEIEGAEKRYLVRLRE